MFNKRKATHMAAYLLSKAGSAGLERIKLMKLMYIADRAAWREVGFSISSDTYVSMERGPALHNTYEELMQDGKDPGPEWSRLISGVRGSDDILYNLCPKVSEEDMGRLSPFDCNKLDAIWERYGGKSTDRLVKITHKFPEWEHPGTLRQKEIKLESILRAIGYQGEMVGKLLEATEEQDEQDAFLASIAA